MNLTTVRKFRITMTRLRVLAHQLKVQIGRLSLPVATPFDKGKCSLYDELEDVFHFHTQCSL